MRRWARGWQQVKNVLTEVRKKKEQRHKADGSLADEVTWRREQVNSESSVEELAALSRTEERLRTQELHDAREWKTRSREKWLAEDGAPARFDLALKNYSDVRSLPGLASLKWIWGLMGNIESDGFRKLEDLAQKQKFIVLTDIKSLKGGVDASLLMGEHTRLGEQHPDVQRLIKWLTAFQISDERLYKLKEWSWENGHEVGVWTI
ncbi:hypothetical protein R1sor_011627 [Riccia sorocarpa]|uniref:Uncharacterized protein n=1 Tax=Riccia sorocarpa TaxID=122646 RepID=A0ABD3I2I0_9MARC